MGEVGFDFSDLDTFTDDLMAVMEIAPKEATKFVKSEAKKGKDVAKQIAQTLVKKDTGNYLKGFKSGTVDLKNKKFSCKYYNNAPHGHLIENGHWQYGGKDNNTKLRFIEGKKVFAKAQVQFQSQFYKDTEEFIEKIAGDIAK